MKINQNQKYRLPASVLLIEHYYNNDDNKYYLLFIYTKDAKIFQLYVLF